jgi:DNA-binding CsgD family transcriptional regulator/PAS domain-containing protein
MRAETLSDIIGTIYECVLEPERWSRALHCISMLGESAASSIVVHDRHGAAASRVFEHGADQSYLRLYFEKLAAAKASPRDSSYLRHVGDLATMTMICGEREPLHSDFYLKWVRPLGFRDMIGVLVLRSGKRLAWFSVARSEIQAFYGDEEMRLMSLLAPHICRAFLITDALDLRTVSASRLEQTVDSLAAGVFLTEQGGRISYMNASAERLVKSGSVLRATNGRLTAVRTRARTALAKALTQSVDGKAPAKTGGHAVALPDEEGTGLVANVLPLEWREGRNPLSALPGAAAVIVQDPAEPPPLAGRAFADLYGFTDAELRVLQVIVRGLAPQEIADDLQLSITTVKTHLRNIFAKTNTSRQVDLIRLLTIATPPVAPARRE